MQPLTRMTDDDRQRNHDLASRLYAEENFTAAAIGGAVAMLLAAIAYGIAVQTWPVTYGFAAAGVGIVVGAAMGYLGRGITMKFAALAAVYTIAGCILGNLFGRILNLAIATKASPIDVFRDTPLPTLADWLFAGWSPMHLVYWFVAVICAGFLARRPLSRAQRLAIGTYELRR